MLLNILKNMLFSDFILICYMLNHKLLSHIPLGVVMMNDSKFLLL